MTDIRDKLRDPRFDGPLNAEAAREIEQLDAKLAECKAIEERPLDDDLNVLLSLCETQSPLSRADQRELFAWLEEKDLIIGDYDAEIEQLRAKLAECKCEPKAT